MPYYIAQRSLSDDEVVQRAYHIFERMTDETVREKKARLGASNMEVFARVADFLDSLHPVFVRKYQDCNPLALLARERRDRVGRGKQAAGWRRLGLRLSGASVGDHVGPEACIGRQDAVVEGEVGPRAGDEGGETADELQRLELEVGGAVTPGVAERNPNAVLVEELEARLRHCRPGDVAAQRLEALAVVRGHRHRGVEVEAVEARMHGAGPSMRPMRVQGVADAPHPSTRLRAQGLQPAERGLLQRG